MAAISGRNRAKTVALLAEGVDRNLHIPTVTPKTSVALLAEGVDRNWKVKTARSLT